VNSDKEVLLTAHHADDAIETFFINLMRGTALKGLTGIKVKNGHTLRPLMSFSSSEIEEYITKNKITFRQDKSNFDNKYLRNNLRNQLIPEFEKNSVNFKTKVNKTISSLNDADKWIESQASKFRLDNFKYLNQTIAIDKTILIEQDNFFLTYVFQQFGIYRSNIISLVKVLNGSSGAKFSTSTHQFNLDRTRLFISENTAQYHTSDSAITISEFPVNIDLGKVRLELDTLNKPRSFLNDSFQQLSLDKIKLPIKIRAWETGDKLQPLGMTGSKLISDVLIDKKIPLFKKSQVLVIVDSDNIIISIPGILISEKVKISANSNHILTIQRIDL